MWTTSGMNRTSERSDSQMRSWSRVNPFWVVAALTVVVTACNKSRQLSNERNPYYVRALQLRKQDRYAEAADAFEKCLRLSPASAEADLQLATLYEDHLGDPLRAVLHYRAYLTKAPKAENVALVREWQTRAEQKLLRSLGEKHPGAVSTSDAARASSSRISDREKRLAQRIKELNTEVLALRSEISMLTHTESTSPAASHPSVAPARAVSAVPTPPATAGQMYRVKEGDTLSRISRKFYGTSRYWEKLRDANTGVLHGGDRLVPGMQLRIPAQTDVAEKR